MKDNPKVYNDLINIYGIGRASAAYICEELGITRRTRYKNMRMAKQDQLKLMLGDLRRLQEPSKEKKPIQFRLKKYIHHNIMNLIKSNAYKGTRHLLSLPVRGQRTKTNHRTSRKLNKSRTLL